MAYRRLTDFLDELTQAGDVARISAEVEVELELAEIARQSALASGPALVFERLARGRRGVIAANLLATEARLCRALHVGRLDDLGAKAEALFSPGSERALDDVRPKTVHKAACRDVVKKGSEVNLLDLSIPRQHAMDFEAVLAGALIAARRPETGETLVSAARIVILDAWTAAIVAPTFSELARFTAAARASGAKLPVAIVLGGDPAYAVLGAAPLPPRLDAWTFAGWLRGAPVELSSDGPSGVPIPADAELVIEGAIAADEPPNLVPPIRYVESSGEMYDVPLEDRLLLRISSISHRSHPLLPLVRIGSSEEELLRRAAVSLGRAWIKTEAPELTGLSIPTFGGPRGFVFAAFQKRRPYHARRIAAALFAQGWLDSAYIVLVDSDVDVHNPDAVWAQVARYADPARDLIHFDAPPQPFAPTRRLAIDATRKTAAERDKASPASPANPAELVKRVQDRWWEYGLGTPGK